MGDKKTDPTWWRTIRQVSDATGVPVATLYGWSFAGFIKRQALGWNARRIREVIKQRRDAGWFTRGRGRAS
jgi:hypothetical protein